MGYIAVILVSDLHSKFKDGSNKYLAKIDEKPIIRHIIDSILEGSLTNNVEKIIIIHSDAYKNEDLAKIQTFFSYGHEKIELEFLLEEEPLGSAHAMKILFENIRFKPSQNMIIFNGNMPFISPQTINNLIQKLKKYGGIFTSFEYEGNCKKNKAIRLKLNNGMPTKALGPAFYETEEPYERDKIENLTLSMTGLFASKIETFITLVQSIKANPYLGRYDLSDLVEQSYKSLYNFTYNICSPYEATIVDNLEDLVIAEKLYQDREKISSIPSSQINLSSIIPTPQIDPSFLKINLNSLAYEFYEVSEYPNNYFLTNANDPLFLLSKNLNQL